MYVGFINIDDMSRIVVKDQIEGIPMDFPFEIENEEFYPGIYVVEFVESMMFSDLEGFEGNPTHKAFLGVFIREVEEIEPEDDYFDEEEWEYSYDDISSVLEENEDDL